MYNCHVDKGLCMSPLSAWQLYNIIHYTLFIESAPHGNYTI